MSTIYGWRTYFWPQGSKSIDLKSEVVTSSLQDKTEIFKLELVASMPMISYCFILVCWNLAAYVCTSLRKRVPFRNAQLCNCVFKFNILQAYISSQKAQHRCIIRSRLELSCYSSSELGTSFNENEITICMFVDPAFEWELKSHI
ncbi:hypothetical protein O6H91_15G027100 [Diphasiastrum complanatum]|uniref:Uncharacterized protein n=1 Tax=Diphasiastrum complanatum TaxID=34168 RepID=A0ACC2BGM9_DIPCM|nr:hypothetical protein O6H91_15G027100 [Diphasiastrum complanatum]